MGQVFLSFSGGLLDKCGVPKQRDCVVCMGIVCTNCESCPSLGTIHRTVAGGASWANDRLYRSTWSMFASYLVLHCDALLDLIGPMDLL